MKTEVEVFQGHQIGGCVTVITYTDGDTVNRIMIDYGSSLPGSNIEKEFEYPWKEKPIDAIFITHYHGDHIGRIFNIPKDVHVPIYMGSVTRQILINIREALSKRKEDGEKYQKELEFLQDDSRIREFEYDTVRRRFKPVTDIPNFTIEPYSVDHSAYDAFMYVIETPDDQKPSGKKVIFHTGDFRGHGRRGKAVVPVIQKYVRRFKKRDVDILITEGTMMSRPDDKEITEAQMQADATKLLRENKYAFLICSSTNLDSLASFYQAAQDAVSVPTKYVAKNIAKNAKKGEASIATTARGKSRYRYMYTYSPYFKKQLEIFTNTAGKFSPVYRFEHVQVLGNLDLELNHPTWKQPKTKKEVMEAAGFLAVIKPEDFCEKYIDAFMDDYHKGVINQKPIIIFSMWKDYLNPNHKARNDEWIAFMNKQEAKGIKVSKLHTSGHAYARMITKVIREVNPQEEIIPMHTECSDAFYELKISQELKDRIRK